MLRCTSGLRGHGVLILTPIVVLGKSPLGSLGVTPQVQDGKVFVSESTDSKGNPFEGSRFDLCILTDEPPYLKCPWQYEQGGRGDIGVKNN